MITAVMVAVYDDGRELLLGQPSATLRGGEDGWVVTLKAERHEAPRGTIATLRLVAGPEASLSLPIAPSVIDRDGAVFTGLLDLVLGTLQDQPAEAPATE